MSGIDINEVYRHTLFFAPFYRNLKNVEIMLDPLAAETLHDFDDPDYDYITNTMYPAHKLSVALPRLNFHNKYVPFKKLQGVLSLFVGSVTTTYRYLLNAYENNNIITNPSYVFYKNETTPDNCTIFNAEKLELPPDEMIQRIKDKEEETWQKTITLSKNSDIIYSRNIFWKIIDDYFLNIDLFIQKITSETEEEHISEPLFHVFKTTLNGSFVKNLNSLIKNDTRIIGLGKYKKKQYDFKNSYLLKTTMVSMQRFGVIKENGKYYEPDAILILTHAKKSSQQGVEIRLAALEENEISDE